MNNNENKGNRKITIVTIIVTILLAFMIVLSFKQGITQEGNYISDYKDLDDLKNSVSFEIIYPSFIYNEKDLEISDLMGQIVEVRNNNFRFKASPFVDIKADVLGIYDELPEDILYGLEENESNISYFRYRCSGKQTLINWVRNDTSYGLILDKVVNIEEAKMLVGVNNYKMHEYTSISDNSITDNLVSYMYVSEANFKFKIPVDIEVKSEYIFNEANIYLVDNMPVIIVAYNNLDKYKEMYKNDAKIIEKNNALIFYKTPDMLSEDSKSLENYYKFVLTIDELLKSIENIE